MFASELIEILKEEISANGDSEIKINISFGIVEIEEIKRIDNDIILE